MIVDNDKYQKILGYSTLDKLTVEDFELRHHKFLNRNVVFAKTNMNFLILSFFAQKPTKTNILYYTCLKKNNKE